MKTRRSIWKRIGLALGAVILVALAGMFAWLMTAAQPMPEALAALGSGPGVIVEQEPWLIFRPAQGEPTTGLIYYPGGRVDYQAYAPYARAIAEQGYLVIIPKMPFNLAVFDPAEAGPIMDAHPEITAWAVGGHSLGGAMAANFAKGNPERVQGLVLVASYPAGSDSLAGNDIPVLSISGSEDGLADPATVEASHALLPASAQFVVIEGGNHAQFGWYGEQSGDNPAQISREAQMDQSVGAIVTFLQNLSR